MAKEESVPPAYLPILISSVSVIVGYGKLIFVLNCKSWILLTPFVCSIALGKFFCLSLFSRLRSIALFLLSSSSLNLASIYLSAVFDLSTSISGASSAVTL